MPFLQALPELVEILRLYMSDVKSSSGFEWWELYLTSSPGVLTISHSAPRRAGLCFPK
jgi:hypothetical protein